ncbi:hypothetical protein G4D82_03695 [Flavobacterium sp. CYK-4]|uniref:GIN domain-containing protein n=1 Tax=Flavobacterium lotistagni TaxID=2709660 RepID=UPI0014076399|nr:DUF2807 domain-containing protein [Flavobacterium lotistagni]NHM06313.1 hypothetical protein [Flavobacterium lotistagni]
MVKIITTLTVILIGFLAKGQTTENRDIADFSKIKISNGIELIYSDGASNSLHLESSNSEILKNTITEVDAKTLNIYLTEGTTLAANETVKVYVSSDQINAISAETKAKITIENVLKTDNIDLRLASGATMTGMIQTSGKVKLYANTGTLFNGKIETNKFQGKFSGNARINLTGSAKKAWVTTSDNTLLSARNFITEAVALHADGKSVAMVYAGDDITLNIASDATVTYIGSPKNINLNEEAEAIIKNKNVSLVYQHEIAMETQK